MESHELEAADCFNSIAKSKLHGFSPELYTLHCDWTDRLLHAAHQQIIQRTTPDECSSSYFSDLSEGNAGRAAPLLPVLIPVLHWPHCEGGSAVPPMVLHRRLPRHRARHALQAGCSLPDLAQLQHARGCEAKACPTRLQHAQEAQAPVWCTCMLQSACAAPHKST